MGLRMQFQSDAVAADAADDDAAVADEVARYGDCGYGGDEDDGYDGHDDESDGDDDEEEDDNDDDDGDYDYADAGQEGG